jgi:hypothetical protein
MPAKPPKLFHVAVRCDMERVYLVEARNREEAGFLARRGQIVEIMERERRVSWHSAYIREAGDG